MNEDQFRNGRISGYNAEVNRGYFFHLAETYGQALNNAHEQAITNFSFIPTIEAAMGRGPLFGRTYFGPAEVLEYIKSKWPNAEHPKQDEQHMVNKAIGLLGDIKEWNKAMEDALHFGTGVTIQDPTGERHVPLDKIFIADKEPGGINFVDDPHDPSTWPWPAQVLVVVASVLITGASVVAFFYMIAAYYTWEWHVDDWSGYRLLSLLGAFVGLIIGIALICEKTEPEKKADNDSE